MTDTKQEKNVLVIGNGFDLYHCLPTRYIDFINVVNRLLELADEQRLQRCSYINYMFGTGSPLYTMPLSQLFEVLFDSSVVVKYPIF